MATPGKSDERDAAAPGQCGFRKGTGGGQFFSQGREKISCLPCLYALLPDLCMIFGGAGEVFLSSVPGSRSPAGHLRDKGENKKGQGAFREAEPPGMANSGLFKSLLKIGDDVLYVFEADGETDHAGGNARIDKLFVAQLAMGGAGWMQNAGADIRDMHKQGDHFQTVDEPGSGFASPLEGKGDDAAASLGQIFGGPFLGKGCRPAWGSARIPPCRRRQGSEPPLRHSDYGVRCGEEGFPGPD